MSPNDQSGPSSGSPNYNKRQVNYLLSRMTALSNAGNHPGVEAARLNLQNDAAVLGLKAVTMTITPEPIPDPAIEALPASVRQRILTLAREFQTRPAAHLVELRGLVAKYPQIPMLRNHLAGALSLTGAREEAKRVIAESARQFPLYIFGFCNYVMMLLEDGELEKIEELVERGPRGPAFVLTDFDSTRNVFHTSEAISYAGMIGHYLLLIKGDVEGAKMQLDVMRKTSAQSPQTRQLAEAIERYQPMSEIANALRTLKSDFKRRNAKRAAKRETGIEPDKKVAAKKKGPKKLPPETGTK